MNFITFKKNSFLINVHINAGTNSNKIIGIHNNKIKINVAAPAIQQKANNLLRNFLSLEFKIPKSNIIIEKGKLGKYKQLKIIKINQIPLIIKRLIKQSSISSLIITKIL
ncbi:DUF167 family protein [Candidatus Pantoea edessiphila]|nr:DUF167 family protein [Candidatus Pantoea edessiphila]